MGQEVEPPNDNTARATAVDEAVFDAGQGLWRRRQSAEHDQQQHLEHSATQER